MFAMALISFDRLNYFLRASPILHLGNLRSCSDFGRFCQQFISFHRNIANVTTYLITKLSTLDTKLIRLGIHILIYYFYLAIN